MIIILRETNPWIKEKDLFNKCLGLKNLQHKTLSLYSAFKYCSESELNANHCILNHFV